MELIIIGVLILAALCVVVLLKKKGDSEETGPVSSESDREPSLEGGSVPLKGSVGENLEKDGQPDRLQKSSGKALQQEDGVSARSQATAAGEKQSVSVKKQAKARPVRTEKEKASSEIYDCINKNLRVLSGSWAKDQLNQVTELGTLSLSVRKYYQEVLRDLPDDMQNILSAYKDAVNLEEKEGLLYLTAKEDADLEKLLFNSMVPFYPYYGKELHEEGIRYGSLLSKDALALFHQLTGRKFRMGFHRRYRSGIDSFDWKDNHYTVRDSKGKLYCDADFRDGQLVSGYARILAEGTGDDLWKVYREGIWENGSLKDGAICYQYQKKISQN